MSWLRELPKIVVLLTLVAAYARGCSVLARSKNGLRVKPLQIALFAAGAAALATALFPPVDDLASRYMWVHMVQHLLLVLVAPALLLLGRPALPLMMALPVRERRTLNSLKHRTVIRRTLSIASSAAFAWVLHVSLLWLWHTPALYDAALRNEPLHVLEHGSFFASALLFWRVLISPRPRARMHVATSFFYVFFAAVQSTALGALLTFASSPIYSFYVDHPGSARSPMEDQQLAGLVMWIPAGVVYVVAAGAIFYSWLGGLERTDAHAKGRRAVVPPLLLVVAFVGAGQFGNGTSEARAGVKTAPQTETTLPPVPDVYRADCAYCHGVEGEGTDLGPPVAGVGEASADFMLRTGRMPIDDSEQYPKREDPAYGENEVRAMVEYIGALAPGPPIPEVDLATGDLAEGEQLYNDNCAACHATTGIGGALTDEAVAPSLRGSTPIQIAEAIRVGGNGREGSMPVFGPETIDQEDLDALVRYVVYLQEPDDRGGAGLGHLGPIAEGFVGWLVGLGALILIILWVGDNAEEAP